MAGEEPSRDADEEADGAGVDPEAGQPAGDGAPDDPEPSSDPAEAGGDAAEDGQDATSDDTVDVATDDREEGDESAQPVAEGDADARESIEADVRSALDDEVRDADGEIDYGALRDVATATEGVPGSGLTKAEMYDAVVEARVAASQDTEDDGDAVRGDTSGADGGEVDEAVEAEAEALVEEMAEAEAAAADDDASTETSIEEMEGESVPLTGDPDTAETGWPGKSGPDEDREMPLAAHIEEMLKRLAVVIAVAGAVSLLVLPFGDRVINFLWYSILPGVETDIARPRLYSVLELWFTRIKVASLAGLVVALPVLVYEAYAFMKPGLYPHERRYYLAAIPTSLVLAVVGVSFAYFVILPAIFVYFLYYSQDVATIGFALGRTFDLILLLMGYMALVFQIPLFLMLAMMMGLVTRRWLAERRILFWGAFLGISFVFSPDPTGMAPIIVAATMIALFEGTLLLTKWSGRE